MIVAGLIGIMVGSFLNVLIGRYDELATIVNSRSRCPHCRQTIAWYDLVPVLSFGLLGGRCRNCRQPISWQYPIVELLTAGLAIHLYSFYGLTAATFVLFPLFALLLVIAVIDIREYLIPDHYMFPVILLAIIAAFTLPQFQDRLPFWGALLGGGTLAFLVGISRERWMGAGDIGLGIVMGLLGGWLGTAVGLVLAFVVGALVGLLFLIFRRKKLGDMVPFGPFLVLGTYVATLWGGMIAEWYLELVHFY